MKNIVIVGAGLSGIVSAFTILKKGLPENSQILLIEKNPIQLGTGVAYKDEFRTQPLNVRANRMSLYMDEPNHFCEWLLLRKDLYQGTWNDFSPMAFVPRSIYGEYLREEFTKWKQKFGERLKIILEEVLAIERTQQKWVLQLSEEKRIEAENVILAIGNFPPADLPVISKRARASVNYHPYPWKTGITTNVPQHEKIGFIGMGLTTIDHLITLFHQNHQGEILTFSRNGLLPLEHVMPQTFYLGEDEVMMNCKTPLSFLKYLRKKVKENEEIHWSNILDAFRPFTNKVWKNWSTEDKSYFIRTIRPYWEIHRHRIPTYSKSIIEKLKSTNQLHQFAGKLESVDLDENEKFVIRLKDKITKKIKEEKVDVLVNCTGPETNFRKFNSALVRQMLDTGLIHLEPLGMGIQTNEEGIILDQNGNPQNGIWAIGPLRKGTLWESVALNEIRIQANAIIV